MSNPNALLSFARTLHQTQEGVFLDGAGESNPSKASKTPKPIVYTPSAAELFDSHQRVVRPFGEILVC